MLPIPLSDSLCQLINHRPADTFRHHVECKRAYGSLMVVVDWCKQECQGDWRWAVRDMPADQLLGIYDFYFDSDSDAVAFSLQWA